MIRSGFIVPVLAVSACGGGYSPNMALLASGPSPQFDGVALQAAANNQDQVVLQISRMAGIPEPERGPRDPDQWAQFGAAAFGRARIECNAYITEIMKVEEHRRTINQQLSLAGAATAGILGVTGVAGTAIAITAMAFGLAQATVDNVTTGMLYSLGAEPVQTLVAKLRVAYTSKLTRASWTDRATSFNLIYGYLELCTPAVLREKIKSAIVKAQPEATGVDSMGGPPQERLRRQAAGCHPRERQSCHSSASAATADLQSCGQRTRHDPRGDQRHPASLVREAGWRSRGARIELEHEGCHSELPRRRWRRQRSTNDERPHVGRVGPVLCARCRRKGPFGGQRGQNLRSAGIPQCL
jgi:hypothetical protein